MGKKVVGVGEGDGVIKGCVDGPKACVDCPFEVLKEVGDWFEWIVGIFWWLE